MCLWNNHGLALYLQKIELTNPMPTETRTATKSLQTRIYDGLDQKLRASPWNGGASEAHGLLAALACKGASDATIRTKAYLLQLDDEPDIEVIEGMFGLIMRDLGNPEFGFNLLLPGDDHSQIERGEGISSWCQGFLQGFCHDDPEAFQGDNVTVTEALQDVMKIGHLELNPEDLEDNERALLELEEFLRVAVQLVYDELQPIDASTLSRLNCWIQ